MLQTVAAASFEFVSLDRDRRGGFVGAYQTAQGHQFQWERVIELGRPTDGQFNALPLRQSGLGSEQHTPAAHVERLAGSNLFDRLLSPEHFVSHVPLDWKTIRAASILADFGAS